MANPELGAKQICPNCSTKFYDLTRRPAHCPKCGTDFDPEEALRNRRVRARAPLPEDDIEEDKVKAAPEDNEDGFEAEPDEAPELDAAADEPPLVTSDDDDGDTPVADEDVGVDFAEDDLADDEDDDVPFLEDEDDDDFSEDEIDGLPDEGDGDDR